MKKQIGIAVLGSLLLVAVLGGIKYAQISAAIAEASSRPMPAEAVTTIIAEKSEWPLTRSAVGSLAPVQGAVLAAEESGRVALVRFESGSKVAAGDVLLELDTSVESALLKGAQADLELALVNEKRQRALRERNANAQSDLDSAERTLQSARAEVERISAVLERKKVIAPFAGTAGIRMVNIGQTISAGTPIVSLQAFNPIYVNFTLPQRDLQGLSLGTEVIVKIDAFPEEEFHGTITAFDSKVDPDTRTITVQATLPNEEERLRPGMFADVTVVSPQTEQVIAIPASSIKYAPYGNNVFVLEPAKDGAGATTVRAQVVTLGRRRGDQVAITTGLKGGEEVVTSGVFKLRPGVAVSVNNEVTPGNELSPKPADT